MKIIEALKKSKANLARLTELAKLVKANSARLSTSTSPYADPATQVSAWVDEYSSLVNENEDLLHRIHATNLSVPVSITIGGRLVTQTIDRWIYRRQHAIALLDGLFSQMTDNGLREAIVPAGVGGETLHVTILRAYDAVSRDTKRAQLADEPRLIDSALEIVNATTELLP